MAWNWVSGYKFFMLEGKYTSASTAIDAIVFHIGGNRSYRTVTLSAAHSAVQVNSGRNTVIELEADVNKIFNANTLIDLYAIHAVMQPGENADKIADNYAIGMFSVRRVNME
jgi:hypothetical protein